MTTESTDTREGRSPDPRLANLQPPWPKGTSGNPKGRPPYKSVRALLQERPDASREEVIEMVFSIATGKVRARPNERIRAAEWIAKHGDDPTTTTIQTDDFTITIAPSTAMQEEDDDDDD